jgi:hypothetical protein
MSKQCSNTKSKPSDLTAIIKAAPSPSATSEMVEP